MISQVMATAGPKGEVLGASVAAATADVLLAVDCDKAAADAAMGFGSMDEVGAGLTAGAKDFFPADNCNRVLMTER